MSRPEVNTSIEVHNLTVAYDKRPVLWNIDFELPCGEIIGLMGPNGAGKSTLVKAIMGLLPLSSGYVKVFHQDLKKLRKKISYIPQRQSVDWNFPARVIDVVLMGRYVHTGLFKRLSSKDYQIAKAALDKVGMLPFTDRQISELSGGQQQRVFLARSLAQEADLYIMDEPFAGVDASTEKAVINLLQDLKAQGKTMLVVHHDLQTARDYFDHLILVNSRLVASGPIEQVFTEENLNTTYSGKLTILSKMAEIVAKSELGVREKKREEFSPKDHV